MHVNVDYPSAEAELAILRLARAEARNQDEQAPAKISQAQLLEMRAATLALHMSEPVESYIVALTCATRDARRYSDQIASAIDYGVSPRASIALERCARANAWLAGRDFVSPEDVQAVVHDVFRHRLVLSFEAEANGITADKVIDQLLQQVAVG
jgi:MoxR-like ATPase